MPGDWRLATGDQQRAEKPSPLRLASVLHIRAANHSTSPMEDQKITRHPHLVSTKAIVSSNQSFSIDEQNRSVIREFLLDQWEKAAPWRQRVPLNGQPQTTTSDFWFNRLWDLHSDKSRHYHTIVHLWEMLSWVEALERDYTIPTHWAPTSPSSFTIPTSSWFCALRLATFFHDAIYDPTSQRNERDSAELWDEFCRFQRNTEEGWLRHHNDGAVNLVKIVRTLILATETHQVVMEYSDTGEGVCGSTPLVDVDLQATFLDIDMAVLGKSRQAYFAYASLIRQEYQHVPRQLYCKKRAEILENFARARTTIYLSSVFQELLEVQAKENLMAEIELLKKGTIPGQLA